MTIPCSVKDRELQKFRECPAGSDETVVAVEICQETGSTIKVEFDQSGIVTNNYSEANAVAGLATATIIDYTVPVGKIFKVQRVEASGENKAVFTVEVDAGVEAKRRSYYTEYNVEFEFLNIVLIAGQNIKVRVENKRVSTSDFNSNLIGVLDDA